MLVNIIMYSINHAPINVQGTCLTIAMQDHREVLLTLIRPNNYTGAAI